MHNKGLICVFSVLFAVGSTQGFAMQPAALMYHNKPIDPLCFFELDKNPVPLANCGIDSEQDRKIDGKNDELIAKGFIGYDYIWPTDADHTTANAFSYYKVIGHVDDRYFVYTVNGTGGSGDFTAVSAVTRSGDMLQVKPLTGGDRCNNGVNNAEVRNNVLYFDVNITPYDYAELGGLNTRKVQAYDDLAACAACCLGTAKYSVDLSKGGELKPKLQMIDFGEKVQPNKQGQGKYEFCFESLIAAYQNQGINQITLKQLTKLMEKFSMKCVS